VYAALHAYVNSVGINVVDTYWRGAKVRLFPLTLLVVLTTVLCYHMHCDIYPYVVYTMMLLVQWDRSIIRWVLVASILGKYFNKVSRRVKLSLCSVFLVRRWIC